MAKQKGTVQVLEDTPEKEIPLVLSKSLHLIDPSAIEHQIIVAGCGATGGVLVLELCRLGFTNFIVYDFDVVELKNINNQVYFIDQVGMPKVQALYQTARRINPELKEEQFRCKKFEKATCNKDLQKSVIFFSCIDKGRKIIHDWLSPDQRVVLYFSLGASHDSYSISVGDLQTKRYIITPSLKDEEKGGERSPCGEVMSLGGVMSLCANNTIQLFRMWAVAKIPIAGKTYFYECFPNVESYAISNKTN